MTPLHLQIQDLYPGTNIDVEVSSGDDDVSMKKSTSNDARDGGASSAELIAPNPIRSNAPGQTDPSVADRVASTDPPVGGCRCKHSPPVHKRKQALPSVD
jgi:hypothetical protein